MAVSTKKDKLIEEAQKLSLRGQFDKAVKVYEQVLALEPSAINQRQKMAELLIKAGRPDDARKEFESIGRHFSQNGFYLKAIAVYKQLQKLFPADISITLSLAGLNEKHGLAANALSEYKQVYDYYEKEGNSAEALKILDKMQNVDPQNISIKIKLAEAFFQHGDKGGAYTQFAKSASLLQERGDSTALSRLTVRVQQLFPDKPDFLREVLAEQIRHGNAASAVSGLQGLLRNNPNDHLVWDLIVEAYGRLQQPMKVKVAYQHYLKYFPDDPAPMAGLINCALAEKDVKGTLDLLDRYESSLMGAGKLAELENAYRELDRLDPINFKVLEGLIRVVEASGNDSEVVVLSSKLQSLRTVSGAGVSEQPEVIAEPEPSALPDFFSTQDSFSSFAEESPPDSVDASCRTEWGEVNAISGVDATSAEQAPTPQSDEEIEIEIDLDIDEDSAKESSESEIAGQEEGQDWLDSVGNLFDTIATSPRGVKFGNEMDSSDAQSHYDLGLAFKEMGLYDEAINEFRQAALDTSRRLECLTMQGACLRERGEYDTAVSMLNSLLKPGLPLEETCAVKYELVLTYESSGNADEANRLLNEIDAENPGFRDVSSRLNAANLENSLDFSDDDLKNF